MAHGYELPRRTSNGQHAHALKVPSKGGETGFFNMYMALEKMPLKIRKSIDGKTLKHEKVHSSDGSIRAGLKDPGTDDIRKFPGPIHPMIMTHPETQREVLYLGRRINAYIMGMPVDESNDLLDQIWQYSTQDKFTWHQSWQVGETIMWDNRNEFSRHDPRLMHRLVVEGSRPYYAP